MKPLVATLRGQRRDPPPIWLMRQAGRYLPEYREVRARLGGFLELCYAPELAARVTLQPIERFGLDAAIIFSDILVVPHALGVEVTFEEGEGPRLAPLRSDADVARLSTTLDSARTEPVYEALRLVRKALPGECALIGFAGAPWTLAAYMVEGRTSRDFETARRLALRDPPTFGRLIYRLSEAVSAHLIGQIEAGAEVVQVFDSWAGVLSASEFARWVAAPTRAVVERVRRAHPEVPIIGFPRGAGASYRDYADATAVDAVGLDAAVPCAWAAREVQNQVPVQGNLDPLTLAVGGRVMQTAVEGILSAFADRPHVFNLGHGIVPDTPPESVSQLTRLVRSWRR